MSHSSLLDCCYKPGELRRYHDPLKTGRAGLAEGHTLPHHRIPSYSNQP
jgi:hypothetical protein